MAIVNNNHIHKGVEGHAKKGTLPRKDGGIRSEVKEQVQEHEAHVLENNDGILADNPTVGVHQITQVLDGGDDHDVPGGENHDLVWLTKGQLIYSERDLSVEQILEVLRQLPPSQSTGVRRCETSTQHEVPSAMEILGGDHSSKGPGEGVGGFYSIDNPTGSPGCLPSDLGDKESRVDRSNRSDGHCPEGQGPEGQGGFDNRTDPIGSGTVHRWPEGADAEGKELPVLIISHEEGRTDTLRVYRFFSGKDPEAWKVVRSTDSGESPRFEEIRSPTDLSIEPDGQDGKGSARGTWTLQHGANETVHRGRGRGPTRDVESPRSILRKNVPERIRPESVPRIDVPIGTPELVETEKVHEWYSQLSRKYDRPQTGGLDAREREAGDRWLEFLEPDYIRDHIDGVLLTVRGDFRY